MLGSAVSWWTWELGQEARGRTQDPARVREAFPPHLWVDLAGGHMQDSWLPSLGSHVPGSGRETTSCAVLSCSVESKSLPFRGL